MSPQRFGGGAPGCSVVTGGPISRTLFGQTPILRTAAAILRSVVSNDPFLSILQNHLIPAIRLPKGRHLLGIIVRFRAPTTCILGSFVLSTPRVFHVSAHFSRQSNFCDRTLNSGIYWVLGGGLKYLRHKDL